MNIIISIFVVTLMSKKLYYPKYVSFLVNKAVREPKIKSAVV